MPDPNRPGGKGVDRFIGNVGKFGKLQAERIYEPARVMGEVRKGNITPDDPEFYTGAAEAAGAATGIGGAFTGGVGPANIGFKQALKRIGKQFKNEREALIWGRALGEYGEAEFKEKMANLGENYVAVISGLRATPRKLLKEVSDIEVDPNITGLGRHYEQSQKIAVQPYAAKKDFDLLLGAVPHEATHAFQVKLGNTPYQEVPYLHPKMRKIWARNKVLRNVLKRVRDKKLYDKLYKSLPSEIEARKMGSELPWAAIGRVEKGESTAVPYNQYINMLEQEQNRWFLAMKKQSPKLWKQVKSELDSEIKLAEMSVKHTKPVFDDLAQQRFNKPYSKLNEKNKQRIRMEAYKERERKLKVIKARYGGKLPSS